MKKEDIAGLFVWIVILGAAAAYFFIAVRGHGTLTDSYILKASGHWIFYVLFFIGALLSGVVLNGIMYELAHVVGAKIGRYDVVSVNILGFNFFKENGKTKFRFSGYDGLTGETKILPKENAKKEPNPSPFLLFGSLFYAFEIVIVIFAFALMTGLSKSTLVADWAYFILTIGVVGGAILFYNLIPFHLDSMTDGYRLKLVGKRNNRHDFNNMLRAEITGKVVEDKEKKEFEENKETNFSSDINLNKAYILLSEGKFNEAKIVFESILENKKANKRVKESAEVQIIYINIYTLSLEEAMIYYRENISLQKAREISDDASMAGIRTYVLLSGLLDKSQSECYRVLEKVQKSYSRVPEARKPLEKKLFNEALDRVIQVHPHWDDLDQYIIK